MYDIPLKTRFDEHVSSLSAPTWLLEMIYPEYISPMLPPLRDYPKEPILASRERIQSDFEKKFRKKSTKSKFLPVSIIISFTTSSQPLSSTVLQCYIPTTCKHGL
jgi:hypothetical protein